MTDFNEIAIFAAAAKEMNFTRAAGKLETSKAAVSRAIVNLETRLKTRLFERTTRRLRLTEAGETYLNYAQRAVEESEQGEAAVLRLNDRPRGMLRVIMPVVLAQWSVAPKLARFLETYPEMTLDIQLKGGQIDPIAQQADVAFQTARPQKDSQLIQKRINVVPMGIYANPAYLAKTARPLKSLEDLKHHTCLGLSGSKKGTFWRVSRGSRTYEMAVRSNVTVGDPVIHRRLCLDGSGLAILPEWLVKSEVQTGRLIRVLAEYVPTPMELYLLYPTRRSMTPKLKAFVEFIKQVIPGADER